MSILLLEELEAAFFAGVIIFFAKTLTAFVLFPRYSLLYLFLFLNAFLKDWD